LPQRHFRTPAKKVANAESTEQERPQLRQPEMDRYLLQIDRQTKQADEAFIQDVRNSAVCGTGNQSPIPRPASLHLRQRK